MLDKIHAQNDILAFKLSSLMVRNEVIQHNIANVDTPGFKRKIVDFENAFARELEKSRNNNSNINFKKASPQIRLINENFSFRLDGNNVDIDVEMAELYKNTVKYDIFINAVINNNRMINLAATGR